MRREDVGPTIHASRISKNVAVVGVAMSSDAAAQPSSDRVRWLGDDADPDA